MVYQHQCWYGIIVMRVRVIRDPDPTSSGLRITVQRWNSGQWEHVTYFGMNQSEEANEFAMKLSMTKRDPVELAVFQDGQKEEPMSLEKRAEVLRQLADSAAYASYPGKFMRESSEQQP